MKQVTQTKNEISKITTFFPRIIREFEDHDEPMIYGGRWN
jgi:hypothetical protein